MATTMMNFPLALVVDAFLSFMHHRFSKPEITPAAYRWNADDRQSRIRISGTHSEDNEKPGSRPSITVDRGAFIFANRMIDNLTSADANTFLNPKYRDWMTGYVDIICESSVASEASSIANYLAYEFQANRKMLAKQTKFIKDLSYTDVSKEMMADADVTPRRWRVVLRIKVNIYIGWISRYNGPTIPFNKASVIATAVEDPYKSIIGSLVINQDLLTDTGANFGLLNTDDPQLLQAELDKDWYYIVFDSDTNKTKYIVSEIVDNNTLRLKYREDGGALVPYSASSTESGVKYSLEWNAPHLYIELPTNN